MKRSDTEALEVAVRALNERNIEPIVGLMTDDMLWKGQRQRWLWWRDAPS